MRFCIKYFSSRAHRGFFLLPHNKRNISAKKELRNNVHASQFSTMNKMNASTDNAIKRNFFFFERGKKKWQPVKKDRSSLFIIRIMLLYPLPVVSTPRFFTSTRPPSFTLRRFFLCIVATKARNSFIFFLRHRDVCTYTYFNDFIFQHINFVTHFRILKTRYLFFSKMCAFFMSRF